jgi:hypothetical protein
MCTIFTYTLIMRMIIHASRNSGLKVRNVMGILLLIVSHVLLVYHNTSIRMGQLADMC